MKNSFFLIIPTQHHKAEQAKQFQEQAIKHWVEELPTANPSLATRLFHDLIVEFNQLEMDFSQRLNALEILRPSYIIIEDYLRSRLIQSGFPKSEGDQKIMDILFAIEKEFALGYWIVARELSGKSISWFQGKNIALSIQRTIKGLSATIITRCLLYRNIPDWVWIDLHSLYKLGAKLNKESIKVAAEFNNSNKFTSIEESYHQILLFILAQPEHLMQREILQVYNFVEQFSDLLRLEMKASAAQNPLFVLRIEDDKPPSLEGKVPRDQDSSLRYLNVEKINKQFKNKAKLSEQGLTRFSPIVAQPLNQQKLPLELIDYLESRWQCQALPHRMNFNDRLNRYVALGLDAAYELQMADLSKDEQDKEYLSESASEYALSCDFPKSGIISIGSLICVRKIDNSESKPHLGVVSKLATKRDDTRISFEIELIAGQFYAVSFEYQDEKKQSGLQKALLYGQKGTEGEERSYIIMESYLLKDGDVVKMTMANESYPIILKDRKNIGLGYWQFECRRIAETASTTRVKQGYDFI